MSNETNNDEVECPKCGHVHECSHEWFSGMHTEAECECENCGAELQVVRDFTVTYYTTLKEVRS